MPLVPNVPNLHGSKSLLVETIGLTNGSYPLYRKLAKKEKKREKACFSSGPYLPMNSPKFHSTTQSRLPRTTQRASGLHDSEYSLIVVIPFSPRSDYTQKKVSHTQVAKFKNTKYLPRWGAHPRVSDGYTPPILEPVSQELAHYGPAPTVGRRGS